MGAIGFEQVLAFWFDELEPAQWFTSDAGLDRLISERYRELHGQASRCERHGWRSASRGRLAEVIVLDQFSRNLFRDSPQAFAADPLALALAQEAIAAGVDQGLTAIERVFLYMPYMHSESAAIHALAVPLSEAAGQPSNLDYELRHKRIIDRFGRYPHRNAVLGRVSTPEERAFLEQPGSGF